MAKKWAISDEPPLKVRLAKETEGDQNEGRVHDKPIRVRTIGRRIVKVLAALWMLSVGAWLQSCYGGDHMTADAGGPHDAIDGHDPFNEL